MKKKLPVFIVFLIVILTFYGCVSQQPEDANDSDAVMTVKPADISGESEKLLEALGENYHYFDLDIEDSMDVTITRWNFKDGKWKVLGDMKVDDESERIWVGCDEYRMMCGNINPDGFRSESDDVTGFYFNDGGYTTWYRSDEREITPGKEITLLTMLRGDYVKDGQSFKECDCEAGIALTLTVDDK